MNIRETLSGNLNSQRLIIAAVIIIAGFGFYFTAENPADNTQDENTITNFPYDQSPSFYPWYWGLITDRVELPNDIKTQTISMSQLTPMATSGKMDAGYIPFLKAGLVADKNPDVELNGYAFYQNETFYTIYTRPETSIQSVEDLEGKTVALPLSLSTGIMSAMVMEDSGVNMENTTLVDKPVSATKPLITSGDVDAALIFGGKHPDLQPVVHIFRYWEEKHEGRLTEAPWILNGPEHYQNSVAAAKAFNRSFSLSMENFDQMSEDFKSETGNDLSEYFRSAEGAKMYRINEKDLEAQQSLMDYAYENGYIDYHANLSELLHKPPAPVEE